MTTITTLNNSFLSYSVDSDTREFIIEDLKSLVKGDGTVLMNQVIEIYKTTPDVDKMSLCAYPTDKTVDTEYLVDFYSKFGFEVIEDAGYGAIMEY